MEAVEVLVGFIAFAALVVVWALAPSKPVAQECAPAIAVKGQVLA